MTLRKYIILLHLLLLQHVVAIEGLEEGIEDWQLVDRLKDFGPIVNFLLLQRPSKLWKFY